LEKREMTEANEAQPFKISVVKLGSKGQKFIVTYQKGYNSMFNQKTYTQENAVGFVKSLIDIDDAGDYTIELDLDDDFISACNEPTKTLFWGLMSKSIVN
jgi:hypothetical protein